jgi:dephospho-CoA kinase
MPAIAITGGIACGKSLVLGSLAALPPNPSTFSADECAHQLLATSQEVQHSLLQHFGPSVLTEHGTVNRQTLRTRITTNPADRRFLESILHPRIRAEWLPLAARAREVGTWFVAEIPLLFETHAHPLFDAIVTVACSPETQTTRLSARKWSAEQIREILIAQAPLADKVQHAHFVIWTDVPIHIVGRQTALLAESLLHTFAERSDSDQPSR